MRSKKTGLPRLETCTAESHTYDMAQGKDVSRLYIFGKKATKKANPIMAREGSTVPL